MINFASSRTFHDQLFKRKRARKVKFIKYSLDHHQKSNLSRTTKAFNNKLVFLDALSFKLNEMNQKYKTKLNVKRFFSQKGEKWKWIESLLIMMVEVVKGFMEM